MHILRFTFIFSLILSLAHHAFAAGAGVIPIFDDGTAFIASENRHGQRVVSDCGGRQDPNETLPQAALRELHEESAGALKNRIQLNHILQAEANGHFADHIHQASGQAYRLYFVRIHGTKPNLQDVRNNAARLIKRYGRHNSHVEKDDWFYIDAQVLKNAAGQNGNLPGVNLPLYAPFKAAHRQPSAQTFLQNVVPLPNAPKQPAPTPKKKQKKVKGGKKKVVKQKKVRVKTKKQRVKKQRQRPTRKHRRR